MHFSTLFLLSILSSFSLCFSNAHAMTVEVHGNQVFAGGQIADDLRKFEDAFANPAVDTVVFVNSPGGDLWTSLRVGRLIEDKGYKTVAAGYCGSGCALMFMGGKERRFSDAFRLSLTYIGIHGAYNKDTKQVVNEIQPQIYAFFKQRMGDQFNSDVMNKALYEMQDNSALLWIHDPTRYPRKTPYFCPSGRIPRSQCTTFADMDAQSLGVITDLDLVKIDLPKSFQITPQVLGQELVNPIVKLEEHLTALAERKCVSDKCKDKMVAFLQQSDHKAISAAIDGTGLSYVWNDDDTNYAMMKSLYACNHPEPDKVRLCEPEVVDGYDMHPIYQTLQNTHAASLQKLVVPKEKFYANEEYGGGFSQASELQTSNFREITPQKVLGVTTINTQELAKLLTEKQPPVLVDVLHIDNVIPSAVSLLAAGFASKNESEDAAFAKSFEGLLRLLAPEQAQPIVFYCSSRDCWLSINAALRAKKIGYNNVSWYRGGLESWTNAGLPTAKAVVRAVAR
jgi:rhodanese-related sulfurtransferase